MVSDRFTFLELFAVVECTIKGHDYCNPVYYVFIMTGSVTLVILIDSLK
jgi:hypothetical protein